MRKENVICIVSKDANQGNVPFYLEHLAVLSKAGLNFPKGL